MSDQSDGVARIAAERQRQIEQEGWTPEHDDEHTDGSMALAAVCFATPRTLLTGYLGSTALTLRDPWPETWEDYWDKRMVCGRNRNEEGEAIVPDPETYTDKERLDLLVKAGALIAAEIDRLLRVTATCAACNTTRLARDLAPRDDDEGSVCVDGCST